MATITSLDTANPPVPGGKFAVSIASFTRPADATAYAALDVISDDVVGGTSKSIVFPGCGRSGAIVTATIAIGETDTIAPRLWLFDSEPTNFFDNTALALVATDMPKIIGHIDFVDADKLLVGTTMNHYTASGPTTAANEMGPGMPYASADGNLYGLLQTVPGYTPASAAKFTIRLSVEHD